MRPIIMSILNGDAKVQNEQDTPNEASVELHSIGFQLGSAYWSSPEIIIGPTSSLRLLTSDLPGMKGR